MLLQKHVQQLFIDILYQRYTDNLYSVTRSNYTLILTHKPETVAVFELPLKVAEAGEGALLGRRGGVEVGRGRAPRYGGRMRSLHSRGNRTAPYT